ncbi:AAA family ATPase [Desertifilum sp. FACHB-1129]|uniref:HTH luxR-type domain-containing protein n=1 Tax=Desertifilum tharense IPPAS B-1220 TaxID=1781255 RepID=A0A1E5QES8_9CYAN|nr:MULTISPECIES: LuxR C-terminal-related transcriptional regulator [Desertifilum]MDA0212910.1 LuxR C-terminal-related transcriptional regulator [Cyanobacteria bacterium FC1]MBD2312522.1 AAA family ATPase [Desertifilum sp. FACHB-1129]MBD2323464.1 AAA family ATPase [Desertifilum sp. FACHB-866]MBD2333309.1 AAA family ATPase [Desertifilum sp. FACHB-868]OEJ73175.1 hypothetical protein BH720_21780 [Desertifilum tharense IPPAS B-1220]
MNQEQFEKRFVELTDKQQEVLLRVLAGETDEEIASSLNIVESTVRKHIEHICKGFRLISQYGERSKRPELIQLFRQYRPDLVKAIAHRDLKEVKKSDEPHVKPRIKRRGARDTTQLDSELYDDAWVDRVELIKKLSIRLRESTRLLILTGITGIGKTVLAQRLAVELQGDWIKWLTVDFESQENTDFATIAVQILTDLGETVTLEDRQETRRLMNWVVSHLQQNRYLLLLDSLECLLRGDAETGWSEFKESCWEEFFQNLLSIKTCESRIILTSQDWPGQFYEINSRYSKLFYCQSLSGFSQSEQLDLFKRTGLNVNPELPSTHYLVRVGSAYEGHPLALWIIAGEIVNPPFNGNILAYWNQYSQEIEKIEQFPQQPEQELLGDNLKLDRYTRKLRGIVKQRIEKTFERLANEIPNAYILLCYCSVYRRPVPEKFYLKTLEKLELDEEQQQITVDVLRDRYLIEENIINNGLHLRQHNLIRSVASTHLKSWRRE